MEDADAHAKGDAVSKHDDKVSVINDQSTNHSTCLTKAGQPIIQPTCRRQVI
jgi:hypothetical protein